MIKFIKTSNGENSPYVDIGISIKDLTPEQFQKTYLGIYSHYFKYLKPSHNIDFNHTSANRFNLLLEKRNWFNIIYKITQIKDDYGREITNGSVRIGRTMNLKDRIYKYKYRSNVNYKGSEKNYHFHRAYNKYGPDAFKFDIISICKTEREAKCTEVFWQIYYNRKNTKYGYDLNINKFFNLIIGDRYKSLKWYNIPKCKLTLDILRGLEKGEIKNKYQIKSYKTLNIRFQKYYGYISLLEVRTMLMRPILRNCIKKGFKISKTLKTLMESGIEVFKKSKNPKRLLSERYCHYLWKKSYYSLRMDLFIRPYVDYLKNLGLTVFVDYITSDELGIIEYLILADIEFQDIAYGLKLCFEKDPYRVKKKARHKIENYLKVRYHKTLGVSSGENKAFDVKIFLKSTYSNKSMYKSYLRNQFSIF